jgi:hypothetical protein
VSNTDPKTDSVLLALLEAQRHGDYAAMERIRAQMAPADVERVLSAAAGELVDRAITESRHQS